MHTLLLVLGLPAALPSPHDYLEARAELTAPADAPPVVTAPTARTRLALKILMVREGACDPGQEGMWFGGGDYPAEVTRARQVWARVGECPQLWEGEGWVPTSDALMARSRYFEQRAAYFREWYAWENDRPELAAAAARYEGLSWSVWEVAGGGGWTQPRRTMLGRLRAAIGAEAWEARELPPGW